MAVGLRNHSDKKSGLYFIAPWRGKSVIGTEWFENDSHPDNLIVNEGQCLKLINGLNAAYPSAKLTLDDIDHVHAGLVPCKIRAANVRENVNLLNHFKIIDHVKDGLDRVISMVGVKYTTAANVAEKTLKYMFPGIKKTSSLVLPQLAGGEIENFSTFKAEIKDRWKSEKIDEDELTQLIFNYGSEAEELIELGSDDNPDNFQNKDSSFDILRGEILFAIRKEMALKLSDVVLRRTELGTDGCPSEESLEETSTIMAKELGWDETRRKSEVNDVKNFYPSFLSSMKSEIQRVPEQASYY
jgi:glycerol-3-phosphate dehydrogenase